MTKKILYVSKGISKEQVKDQSNEKIDLIILEDPNIFGDKGLPNKAVPLGDFFQKDQFKEMEDISKGFPDRLAKYLPEKYLKHRNINLIELVRRSIEADVLKDLPIMFSLANLVEKVPPEEIIYLGSNSNFSYTFLKRLVSSKKIRIKSVDNLYFNVKEFGLILQKYRHGFPLILFTLLKLILRFLMIRNRGYSMNRQGQPILFAPNHPNHISYLQPIIKEFQTQNVPVGVLLSGRLNYSQETLRESKFVETGIGYRYFEGFFGLKQIFSTAFYLIDYWKNLRKIKSFEIMIHGRSFGEVYRERIKSFVYLMLKAKVFTDLSYKALEKYKPRLVVVTDDTWAFNGKTLVETAKSLGVKTVVLQHGILLKDPAYQRLNSDYCLVWGKKSFRDYLNNGIEKSRLKIVGTHILDGRSNLSNNRHYPSEYRSAGHTKIILFTSQHASRDLSQIEKDFTNWVLLNSVKELKNIHLIYRAHPIEVSSIATLSSEYNNKDIIFNNTDSLEQVISKSDLVITVFSTTVLNAIIYHKPAVSLNVSSKHSIAPFVLDGSILEITENLQLQQVVKKIIGDSKFRKKLIKQQKKFLESYVSYVSKEAMQKTVNALLEIYSE